MEIYKPPDSDHKLIVLWISASYKGAQINDSMKSGKKTWNKTRTKQTIKRKKEILEVKNKRNEATNPTENSQQQTQAEEKHLWSAQAGDLEDTWSEWKKGKKNEKEWRKPTDLCDVTKWMTHALGETNRWR